MFNINVSYTRKVIRMHLSTEAKISVHPEREKRVLPALERYESGRPYEVARAPFWTNQSGSSQSGRIRGFHRLNPMKRKLASFLFVTLAYVIAGYAFFLIFFRSQF
jgi:hypothetical protein